MNTPTKQGKTIAVIGAGGIGSALVTALAARDDVATVWSLHRQAPATPTKGEGGVRSLALDVTKVDTIARAAEAIDTDLDWVIVATGTLHDASGRMPEKSFRQLDAGFMQSVLAVNTVGPAMVARDFLPRLPKDRPAIFAALSARVGSIADNRLGGWYSYRASKAALNMLLKSLAIEVRRQRPLACVAGLHPGTVDTPLSAPFQRNVPKDKLFAADDAAGKLVRVLDSLTPEQSGQVFDWAGKRVPE